MGIYTECAGLAASYLGALRSAGIQATMDLTAISKPGVLLRAPAVTVGGLGKAADIAWSAVVVGPGLARSNALDQLAPLADAANVALQGRVAAFDPVDLVLPGGDTLPGIELTWRTSYRRPI